MSARATQGLSFRPLHAESAHQLRQRHAESAEAQGGSLRDGHHRALPSPREQRGRSPDRDVPGGSLGPPCRGYHRGTLGHQGLSGHHQ